MNRNYFILAHFVILRMFKVSAEVFVSKNKALFSPKLSAMAGKSDGITILREASVYKKWLKSRRAAPLLQIHSQICRWSCSLPVCLGESCRSQAPGWIFCCAAAGPSAWRAGRSPGRSYRSQRCSTGSCWWSLRKGTEEAGNTHVSSKKRLPLDALYNISWMMLKWTSKGYPEMYRES